MKPQYIFLDVDGTLMYHTSNSNNIIPSLAITAIQSSRKNGHKVFICTGRIRSEITDDIKDIGFDGFIYASGATVEISGETIFQHNISISELERFRNIAANHKLGFVLQSVDFNFIDKQGASFFDNIDYERDKTSELRHLTRDIFTDMSNFNYGQCPIGKIVFFSYDYDLLEEIKSSIKNDYCMAIHGTRKDKILLGEISTKTVIKSTGIKKVLDFIGADKKNTMAYGDSNNDRDMLLFCNKGVCMGNGVDEIKKIADEICAPVYANGIYKSFLTNGLI